MRVIYQQVVSYINTNDDVVPSSFTQHRHLHSPEVASSLYTIMSHLQFYSYEGFGEALSEEYWYSQAVRVGDRIECSGQGIYILDFHT